MSEKEKPQIPLAKAVKKEPKGSEITARYYVRPLGFNSEVDTSVDRTVRLSLGEKLSIPPGARKKGEPVPTPAPESEDENWFGDVKQDVESAARTMDAESETAADKAKEPQTAPEQKTPSGPPVAEPMKVIIEKEPGLVDEILKMIKGREKEEDDRAAAVHAETAAKKAEADRKKEVGGFRGAGSKIRVILPETEDEVRQENLIRIANAMIRSSESEDKKK
jgi:hypothetical protein